MTQTEAAKILGCNKSNINRRLKAAGIKPGYLEKYRTHKPDVMESVQYRILESINAGDIKKASLQQKITAAGILEDKIRLNRGLATGNMAVHHIHENLDNRLNKALGLRSSTDDKTITDVTC